jgi:ABC-type protease/lipase transport system fused ATPase/permease subunit
MEKGAMVEKTREALSPFETESIVGFVKNLSFQSFQDHPWLILVFLVIFFYAVVRRSRFLLLFLFTFLSAIMLVRYALPTDGALSVRALLPLAAGGLSIGGVIIYFSFIKTE